MNNEREHSKFLIQRYDHYIAAANIKGNFLLAFNTFLAGIILANFKELKELIQDKDMIIFLYWLLIAVFLIAIASTCLVISAVYPFFRSGKSSKDKYHSLIFFKTVAEHEEKEFIEQFQNQEDEAVEKDYSKQVYWLAKGLTSKYYRLGWAMRGILIELVIILAIIILISKY